MLATKTIWEALVSEAEALEIFDQVKPYPFHRINDAAFLTDFPGLKLPACLIVCLGWTTTAKGSGKYKEMRWSAVIVDKDPAGAAWKSVVDLVDQFGAVLDQQILDDELTIMGSNDVGVAFTSPEFAVYEVGFSTREGAAR